MERLRRRKSESSACFRLFAGAFLFIVTLGVSASALPNGTLSANSDEIHTSLWYFRHEFWRTVRADDPVIVPIADAIRDVTQNPLHQLVMVNDVTTLLVEYDSDERVYGQDDFHATLDEMIARQHAAGWAYLRDDCDGRAVFAAHLLAALGIPWRLEASYWKEHAWIVARVNGADYDLLDLPPGSEYSDGFAYRLVGHFFVHRSNPPPVFNWRAAWAVRTHHNLRIGLTLGMLRLDSTQYAMHPRHAVDWTLIAPNASLPPPDDRATLLAGVAGFPYGTPLHPAALATSNPVHAPPAAAVLGSITGDNSSPLR